MAWLGQPVQPLPQIARKAQNGITGQAADQPYFFAQAQTKDRLAQVQTPAAGPSRPGDRNEAPAAPRENPPGLTVPIKPDKSPPPEPNAPTPRPGGTGTAPATGTPPSTPATVTPAPATPAPPVESTISAAAAEGREIADVRVVGNRVVPAPSILQPLGTRAGGAFASRQIELDRAKIDALGFFASVQVQVTPSLEDMNKVSVTFVVAENRVVTCFRFEGNTVLKSEDLQKVLETKIGTVLNRNTVNSDVGKIQEVYRTRGFAALVTDAKQLEDGCVVFQMQEGKVCRIDLSGLKKTREGLVRKLILTKPNDPFDQRRIREDLNRIYDTGFFEDVNFKVDDDPDKPGCLIVTIGLQEKRTGSFTLGVGFDSRSKISGFATLAENNFRGSGRRLSASVELGSQRSYDLGYGNPFIGKNNASYEVSIFDRRIFREPRSLTGSNVTIDTTSFYEEQRTGGRINYNMPLNQQRSRSLLFGLRNERARLFRTSTTDPGTRLDLDVGSGRIFAASTGFLRDRRDLRLDPSSGGREQLILERAFEFLGGSRSFTKMDLDVRRYLPLVRAAKLGEQPKVVLAGRVVVGHSFGQLPAFEQYFVGGSDTVRGYDVDEQFGDNQLYSNIELRYRLQRKFQIVGFFDVGRADGGQYSSTRNDLLYGMGAGLRLSTPIGPIRLDVGRGRDGIRTHFAIGPTF